MTTGGVKCWGGNYEAQLGNGEAGFYTTPRDVVGSPFVGTLPTTTTITSDTPDPSVYGQPYTVAVSVTASSGTPDGTVAVQDGEGHTCTVTLAAGVGSCQLPSIDIGARNISAVYTPASSAFAASTTASNSGHTVNKANTTTTITAHTPDPSLVGFPVAVSVKVAALAPGAGLPTGSVVVTANGASPETCTVTALDANGEGSCNITFTSTGARGLAASYNGDPRFVASASAGVAHQVNLGATTTTITASPASVVFGTAASVTATVTGGINPTGNVTITAAPGGQSCTTALASGSATCSLTPGNVGAYTLTAVYVGDANDATSSSAGTALSVTKATATVTINAADLAQTFGATRPVASTTTPVTTLTVDTTYNLSSTAPTQAGSYNVVATVSDINYQGTASATLVIAKAVGTATISPTSFVYDGTPHAPTVTISGETATCTLVPTSATAAGAHTFTASNCASANYTAPTASVTVTISGARNDDTGVTYASIQAAIDAASLTTLQTIEIAPGTYSGGLVISRPVILTAADPTPMAMPDAPVPSAAGPVSPPVIIDGGGSPGNGINVALNVANVTINGLWVRNFGGHCVFAAGGTNGLTVSDSKLSACGRSGFFMDVETSVDGVTLDGNEVTDVGSLDPDARGMVIWDEYKKNIAITDNYVHDLSRCCGIELQDGSASGVTVTGNWVENVGDSGMAFIGLTGGTPAGNVISGNIITNTGRFGIEIKQPNGSGKNSGEGSIVIDGNVITRTLPIGAEARDLAGIGVYRRGWAAGNANIPTGVIVTNNTVSGYRQGSTSDGFGIVLEGTQMRASGNNLSNNDVGLQIQAGHAPYVANNAADGDQSNLADTYFGRGNSPVACADVGTNTFSGLPANTANEREVGPVNDYVAINPDTGRFYCSIQSAIDDPLTEPLDTILISSPTPIKEQVTDNKGVHLTATSLNAVTWEAPSALSGPPALLRITAAGAKVSNLVFNVDQNLLGTGIAVYTPGANVAPNNVQIIGNRIVARLTSGSPIGDNNLRTAISLNGRSFPQMTGSALSGLVVQNNLIQTGTSTFVRGIDFDDAPNSPFVAGPPSAATDALTPILWVDGNTINASLQDADLRYGNGVVKVTNNTFNGAGLEAGEPEGLYVIRNNIFNPLTPTLRSFAVKSLGGGVGYVHAQGNAFSNHLIGVAVQNSTNVHLIGNTFSAPGAGDFVHLWINSRAIGGIPGSTAALNADVQGNTFTGPTAGGPRGNAVVLGDHDYRASRAVGTFDFGSTTPNVFTGNYNNYFYLDPSDCPNSNTAVGCASGNAYTAIYGSLTASVMKPFPADVIAGNNTYLGKKPAAMNLAEVTDLQARTYHNDPAFTESPAAPATLGMVEYALPANVIATTTSILSALPAHGVVGTNVAVTVKVVTNSPFNGTPTGTVTVAGVGPGAGASCTFDFPEFNSCSLGAFTSSGLKSITATFTDGAAAGSSATVNYQVFTAPIGPNPGGTTEVTPVAAANATATDNDYTRINNAVQLLQTGDTLVLDGTFNWTETNAAVSWARGSDGVGGNTDDYSIQPPRGRANVTITAAITGATIAGPGDLPISNQESVFYMLGGSFKGWTISDLHLQGFERAIYMYFTGSPTDGFENVKILRNTITIPDDLNPTVAPADTGQNIGIHYAYGRNQVIDGNVFHITANGVSTATTNSSIVVIQSNTSGGNLYDGLRIRNNTIHVTSSGPLAAIPPRLVGLWENAHDHTALDIEITGNRFLNETGQAPPGNNRWNGFMMTSQSAGVAYRNNTVIGASTAFTTYIGGYAPAPTSAPILLEGNTLIGNVTAIRGDSDNSNSKITARFNRIAGNALVPVGVGIEQLRSTITAEDNWWGCNGGPTTAGCTSLTGTPTVPTVSTWLKLTISADPVSIEANSGEQSDIDTRLVDQASNAPPLGIGAFPTAEYGFTSNFGILGDSSVESADGEAQTTFKSATAGGAVITTTLDAGSASTNVLVTDDGGPGATVTITPASPQGPIDNDYTRINNAVQSLHAGDTLILSGSFDWRSGFARASFAAGSDGNAASTSDNWSIRLPVGVSYGDIAIRATSIGGATVLAGGDSIKAGPAYQTSFISIYDAAIGSTPARRYNDIVIENLVLDGFDHALDFSNGSGTFPDVYNGVRIANNRFVLHVDNAEGYQSAIAIGYGTGVEVQDNAIDIAIAGSSPPSSYYGFINESGGASGVYNDLLIDRNVITVTGAPGATPPRVVGIWDNGEDSNSNVSITRNTFTGTGAASTSRQTGVIASTHSNGSRISLVRGNRISNAAVGLTTQRDGFGHYAGTTGAQIVEGNTFVNNAVAIQLRPGRASDSLTPSSIVRYNRIVGSGIGIQREAAAAGEQLALVDAVNNWWGCNVGPSASSASGCSTVSGLPVPSSWLKLRIAASPTSFVAGGSSTITTDLVASSGSLMPGELAVFPVADYGYTTSLGGITPPTDPQPAGLAHATLTSANAGGALVTTTLDAGSASTTVLVTNAVGPPNTVTLTPATSPTAVDNDYTRINNAVQALANNTTLILSGQFNWTETNASISWSKGSDGIAVNDDDYAIEPPRNLDGVTITAPTPGGATITGPGDLATANLEGVFSLYGGSFRNWTISNLRLDGFDLALGMFHNGSPQDAFLSLRVLDNRISVPADLNTTAAPTDTNQNIGIHYSYGKNQEFARNEFVIDASGLGNGANQATTIAMQSTTSGNGYYDGLRIHHNTIRLVGTVSVDPAKIYGIWENDQNFATPADMVISDNQFLNQTGSLPPAGNLWRGFMLTSQSVGAKQMVYRNNTVDGASVGFTTFIGGYTPAASSLPTLIEGNTLTNNRTGIRVESANGNAKVIAQFNRIAGNGVGVEQINATVDARNNWWGCNAGPSALGCTSTLGTPTTTPWLKLSIASDTQTVGAGGLALLKASVNGNSVGDNLSGTTAFPVTEIAFTDNSSATWATPTSLTGSTLSTRGIAGNTLSGIQTQTVATATLDGQAVSTTINVNQVSLHVDLPAAGVVGITSASFPLVIDNNGVALTESSKVFLTVKRTPSPLAPGNLVLEYQSPSNPANWLPVVLTQQSGSTDTLIGQMSVGTLAAGTLTVNLRATSTVAGTIEFFAILVGDTSNALYSSDGGSVLVATSAQLQIGLVSGSPQSAQVNTAYVAPLVVKVTDSAGNPLANVPVTFSGPTSGATVSFAVPSGVTASDGTISSGTVTANSTAGAVNTAQATIHGSTCTVNCQVGFALTNTVTGSGAGLDITGDTVGVVTVPSAAPIHSSSTATVQLSAAAPTENVIAHLTISRPGGITPADLSIDYLATTQEFAACTPATPSGFWCPLTLTQSVSSLAATFGPASGFPLVDDAASTFRTRYQRGGQYTVTTTMDGVTSNQTYASGSRMVAVADLDLSGTPVASNGNTGVALDTAVSLVNSGNAPLGIGAPTPNNRDVIGEFTITPASGSITPADVVVRYFFGGNYVSINTSQNGNAITGTFGGSGFPVAAGYSATSLFRTTFLVAGNYTVTTRIIGAASATDVFAETVQTASIGTSSSSIAIDAASLSQTYNTLAHPVVVSTMPAGLAYTLTYTGVMSTVYPTTSTPPTNAGDYAVVATITSPGYSGTANEVLVVAKAASTVTIAGPLTQDFGATTALTATASPISTGSVSITYNGSATTPTAVGSYAVVATLNDPNYTGSATATLVVRDAANVAITFTAPEMSLVTPATAPFSTQTPYNGTLANTGGSTSQKVHYRITAVRIDDGNGNAGLPPAIDADDVEVCLFDPSGYAAQSPSGHRNCPSPYQSLFISRSTGSLNGRASVSFRYPNLAANDDFLVSTGATPITLPPTLFQFKRGEYRVQVDVVGSDNNTIYATASDTTSVPQAAIAYNGATSGPTEQALLSTTNLSNTGGRVVGNVIVRVTLSDAASATLSATDADFAYLDGSTFVTLPWTQSGNNLVTEFGPPITGFELPDGHNQNTAGRGIFHRAGSYGLLYEVVDVATGLVIHASTQQALTIAANQVNFTLSDLSQVYNGSPRAVTVTPAAVPHSVVYEPAPLTGSCPLSAGGSNTSPPTDAGSYCVYVTALGSYEGSARGRLEVLKASATVQIGGLVGGLVGRTYQAATQQVVTATATPAVAVIHVTYDGSTTAPINAGSYALVATIDDANYQGSSTGTLMISIAGGATITLNGVVGGNISRAYTGMQQAPVTATTTPAIAYTVTYAGSGATVYPLTSTPPTAVGSYAVVATTADANYAPVSASGTLIVANASNATLSFSATPSSLAVNATSTTSATLDNSTGGPIGENVLVRYTITRNVAGLVPADIALRYNAGGLQPLGLSQIGSSLVGYFGPQPGGFPVAANYTATTAGDAVFHVAGVYSLTLDLVGVTTSTVFATTSSTVTVGQGSGTITIDPSTLGTIYNGSPRPVTVTTSPAGLAYTLSYTGLTGPAYPTNAAAPTNAGTYSVVATLNDPNFSGSDTKILTIAKAVSPVTFAGPTNVVYTGAAQNPLSATLVLESANAAACVVTYAPVATPTNVGTYTATATCSGVNYTGTASTTLTISASNATVTLSNLAQTYDGSFRAVTVTTNPVGLTTAVTYNGSATVPTNAGTYNVVATITSAGYSGTTSGTLIVDKAIATVTIGNLTHVYNTLAKNATATTTPLGVPVTFTYNGGTALPVNAGSYTVVATANGPNHAGTATATLVIDKAVATVGLSALSQTYDGTPRNATVSTAPPGLAVSVTYNGSPTAPTPVGSYAVVATVVDANYQGSNSGTLVIGKATATVTLTNLAQAYTGSPISAAAITSPAGLGVTLTYNGSATPPTAVGSYTVLATIVDANYSGSGSATLTITQATASVTLGNLSQVYNGAPRAVSVTTNPLGLPRTITYDGSSTPPSAVGSYAVAVTITDPNYTGSATATLTITKATATVTLGGLSQIHDGTPRVVTASTAPGGLTVAITYNGSSTAPTNVGSYAVVATVNDATYEGSATGILVVTNGNATVNVSNLNQVYDGSPKPVTVVTNPVGLTTSVTYNGSATVPTNAGSYTVVATITSPGYSGSGAGTLVIEKALASVVIGNLSHVYNGLAKNATATTTPPGVPVTFTYNGSAAAPINAGSYAVVATASNANYSGSATDTLIIAKAPATVTLSNLAQVYNGTPRSATVTTAPAGLAVSVSYDGNSVPPLAVGSYAVSASVVDPNHQGSANGILVISKAIATVTLGNLAQTYTGSPISASALTTPAGLAVDLTYNGNPVAPTAVGSYTVAATINDASYSGSGSATLTISKATAAIVIGNLSQAYDGAPKVVSVSTTPAGLPHTVTYNGAAALPSAVGSYAVEVTVNDPSYAGTATATLVITKGAALVSLSNLSQIYDGSPKPVTVTTTPNGLATTVTYDGSATPPTSTGSYAVVATVNDSTWQGSASGTLVITTGNATVTLSNLAQTYDGTARPVVVTTNPVGLTTSVTYNGSATVPVNAGSYTVIATVTSAGYSGTGAGTLVVAKASAAVNLGALAQTYDGSARVVTATTTPAGLTVNLSYAGNPAAPLNAGTYAVTGTISDANYQGSASASLVVAKATAPVVLAGLSQTYSGAPRTVTATTTPAGLSVAITYTGSITAPVDAGSYAIVATINDANYQGTTTGTLVVAKATATVAVSNLSQSFNGTPRPVTVTTTPAGLSTTITYNGGATVPSAVGSYAVLATITSSNYEGFGSGTLVIGDGSATITLTGLSYVYDGSPKSASATTNPSGLSVAFTYDGSATPPTNAGSYGVVATITSSGYSGTANGTLIISKAAASVTLGSLNPIYDGAPKSATATTTPSGLTVTYSYDGSAVAPTNAGTYLVVATVSDSNYSGTATATLTIAKAAATVTLSGLNQAYTGTPRTVIVTTAPTGLATAVTYDGSATAPTAVGTYAVSATITNPNYTGSAVGTLQVSAGTAGSIAANGPTAYTGTLSQPIVGGLPSVRVSDAGGNPVAGVVVTFSAGANSGSLSGAVQTTGSNGVATLGGWVLGASATTQTVTATGASVPGSVIFTATAGGTVNLVVSIDSGRQYVRAGQSISHLVTVGNSGSLLATGVTLATTLPAELDAASLQWICVPSAGSSCGSANSGIGNLPTAVTIAAGGNLSFVLTGSVLPGPTDTLSVSVSATRPAGTTGSNGSASDSTQVVIFRDGFEQGGDGAQWPTGSNGDLTSVNIEAGRSSVVEINHALLGNGRITTLARGAGGSFRVEATWIDGHAWLRLVTLDGDRETSSEWTAINTGQTRFSLSLQAGANGTATLSLVAGDVSLQQGIAASEAMTIYAAGLSGEGVGRD